jgi:hypothetical protein
MNCPSCGSPNSEDAKFCNLCYHPFVSTQEESPEAILPQQNESQPDNILQPQTEPQANINAQPQNDQSQTTVDDTVFRRSWFERHLNLTLILADIVAYAAIIAIANFHCFINRMPLSFFPGEIASCPAYVHVLAVIFGLAATFGVGSWMLVKKDRRLTWLLLLFTGPIGIIVFLFLENMSPDDDNLSELSALDTAETKVFYQ